MKTDRQWFATLLLTTLIAVAWIGCRSSSGLQAELALINGKIWTVDKNQPEAEAVAAWQGRILAVGSTREIRMLVGDETEVIDLEGKRVVPGFNDNHTHFLSAGFWLAGVKLKDSKNEEEFGQRLAAKSKELPAGAWILEGTWDHDNWPGGALPTAELIDRYVPNRPVFVTRYDGHMSVANSVALGLAGITSRTPDPPGGVIVRKRGSRAPAGVLKDTAQDLVYRVIPAPTEVEQRLAIEAALAQARRVGVTSLQDMNLDATTLRIYKQLLREGKLTVRIDGRWPLGKWKELADVGITRNLRDSDWIKIGGLKGMVDGSLGSSTAVFFDPYTQDPTTHGVYVTQPEEMRQLVLAADNAGLHVAVHAIGDSANSVLLDIFAEAIERMDRATAVFELSTRSTFTQRIFNATPIWT